MVILRPNHTQLIPQTMASPSRASSEPEKISSVDTENPFIAFRHFADAQMSSLLGSVIGFPSLFSQPGSGNRWPSLDDSVAKSTEGLTRARRELTEEVERDVQEPCHGRVASAKRRENEMSKWGASFDATKADRSRGKEKLDREATETRREKLGWDGKQRARALALGHDKTKKDNEETCPFSTWWDDANLERVVHHPDNGHGFWMARGDPTLSSKRVTDQDPFSEPGQAVSWLLTDDYSPLYLDGTLPFKLHPSRYKIDTNDSHFRDDYQSRDLYPRYASDSVLRHDPSLAIKVNWRAAFQDLLEVHRKGALPPQSQVMKAHHNSFCSPGVGSWIASLIDGGSLGPLWRTLSTPGPVLGPYRFRHGNSPQVWAVSPLLGRFLVRDSTGRYPLAQFGYYDRRNDILPLMASSSESPDGWSAPTGPQMNERSESSGNIGQLMCPLGAEAREQLEALEESVLNWPHRAAFISAVTSLIQNPDTEQSTLRSVDRVERMMKNPDIEDGVADILDKALTSTITESPKTLEAWFSDVDQLLRNDFYDEWKAAKEVVDYEYHHVYGPSFEETGEQTLRSSPSASSASHSPSSSSSTSYFHKSDSGSDRPANSVTSTLTTVESRTLPDGRIKTKRTSKKSFADGREENSESIDIQPGPRDRPVDERPLSEKVETKVPTMPEPRRASAQNGRNGGGWFWN